MRAFLLGVFLFNFLISEAQVRIACSSNMVPALNAWIESSGLDGVEVIPGATTNLYHQFINGAPFDIFICADPEISTLIKKDKAWVESEVLNQGYLVEWRFAEKLKVQSVNDKSPRLHWAMPDPNVAPYGKLAQTRWQNLEGIEDRIVYGESVVQVNQYILSGTVSRALTSNSIISLLEKSGGVINEFQDLSLDNIAHLLKMNPESKLVFESLIDEKNHEIWAKYNFLLPE